MRKITGHPLKNDQINREDCTVIEFFTERSLLFYETCFTRRHLLI